MKGRITREEGIGKRGTILRLAKSGQLGHIRATLPQLRNAVTTATTGTISKGWMRVEG